MKRYYLSPIIGTGSEFDAYRPKVDTYGVAWAGGMKRNPTTGVPVFAWMLVIVEAKNHTPLLLDPDIYGLPDFPLDGKVSAIQTNTKNAMIAALQARGIDTALVGSADGYRDVLEGIGKTQEPTFDINNLDVA